MMPSDFEDLYNRWDPSRDQSEVIAQTNLGLQYYHGQGVAKDYAKAMNLIQAAAKTGFPPAQFVLGSMYDNGKAVPRNEEEALKWYERAARQGHSQAADCAKLIKDRRFVLGEVNRTQGAQQSGEAPAKSKSNCFIATAAYGSSDAPDVQTLRHFRDERLAARPIGRILIVLYERLSPPAADFIAQRPWLRALARRLLVRPLARLVEIKMR
jgi:hypothetical protein